MVESDDEFTDLCSKLLKRVKKNKPSEGQNIPKTSTAARSKLKKLKPSKKQTCNGDSKEAEQTSSKEAEQTSKARHGNPGDSDGTERRCAVQTSKAGPGPDKPSDGTERRCAVQTSKAGPEPDKPSDGTENRFAVQTSNARPWPEKPSDGTERRCTVQTSKAGPGPEKLSDGTKRRRTVQTSKAGPGSEKLSDGTERRCAVQTSKAGPGSEKLSDGTERRCAVQTSKAEPGSEKLSNGTQRSCAVLTHLSNVHIEKDGNEAECQAETARHLDQLSVKHLILERMQQFKRASPKRMKLDSTEVYGAHDSSEALHTDVALAMALQMDVKEQPVSLEDEGLFFCQLCQKDLTAMNSALREQHVNRCLDQDESIGGSSLAPTVPSCPLCGKPFNTEKSRASHLKRCAAKLNVPAQTLLQAVQRQASETVPPRVAHVKRKGIPKQKEPAKKRKMTQMGAEVDDLLVAMALSRSMQEDNAEPNAVRARPLPAIQPPEKKSRRKQKEKPTPLLLVQAPEEAVLKLQKRMSTLLTEELKEKSILALPLSRFWSMEVEEWDTWSMRGGKDCAFWEFSNMMENRDALSYYTAELNPPITPWNPPSKKLLSSQPREVTTALTSGSSQSQGPVNKDLHPGIPCEDQTTPSDSQKALLDLVELAGEGMTLTQWNYGASSTSDRTGRESPVIITPSGFIPSQEKENNNQIQAPYMAPLVALASDFMEMVNNPHLSDAQLQTDCGEVLNVHMLVLYARCPLLVEAVHSEGFWVHEASMGRVRRLLLNDVSAEAALSFIRFLYSANTAIPSHCLSHVCELARRFGVKSLIDICEQLVGEPQSAETPVTTEEDGDTGGERAETFQELLKSMWLDECEDLFTDQEAEGLPEEEHLDDGGVGEGELEEIYEFAATQRKMPVEQEKEVGSSSEQEEHRDKDSEDSSPEVRNHVVGRREQIIDAVKQRSTKCHIQTSVINTTPHKVSPAQKAVMCSPVGKSPARFKSNSLESSPSFSPLASPAQLKTPPNPTCSVSPIQSPSRFSVPAASPARRLFNNYLAKHSQSPLATPEKCALSVVHTVPLISPSRSEGPEGDVFAQRSPPPLDDSYDRMFSETCGEYVEPSGTCESRSHVNPASPQDQTSVLTSSPSAKSCPTLPELGSSPNNQPRTSSFLEISSYSVVEHGMSPPSRLQDSHHIAPIHESSSKPTSSPKALCQDIILILSSDEETESSTQDIAQNHTSVMSKSIKESPISFSIRKSNENLSRLEMSSSSENSWLVPATPMPNLTESRISQLQTSHFPLLPQTSLQTLCLPQSPRASKTCDQSVSHPSFVDPSQTHSVCPPLFSPKTSFILNQSLCSHITEKHGKLHEVCSSSASKDLSSPPTSFASSTVFEVVDSEDEGPVPEGPEPEPQADTSGCSFHIDYDEPPIHIEDLWSDMQETPTRPYSSPKRNIPSHIYETPSKPSEIKSSGTLLKGNTEPSSSQESPDTTALHSNQVSYMNSKLWDEWGDEDPELPAVLPLSQRLNKVPDVQKELRTPVTIVRRRELAPKVPITPLPHYSDMDTPVLKKELNRFGVRALPKKQMVLKLKEIFSYTHQLMSSDSEDDVPPSQPHQRVHSSVAQQQPAPRKQRPGATAKAPSNAKRGKKVPPVSTAQEADTGEDQSLTASQESTTSSVAASDTSSLSHSSNTNEFETAFADEEDDEPVAASQVASKEALTAEAVRRFIESHPELHKRILLYQPLDLASLHAELKQSGIKVAAGKLLDFLDVHCVTFTTAAARKEKKSRGKRKAGKRH
ncbi:structure-specific endonuclease subunit SLX4 isoform X2 [Mixophyes fleayi]|uniref:structure-specific endonuclease subunit SLX4 isoform X2 n=1 Tax=Mixophyes fleayi TaxID=3061075 RepID=UPI003F4E0AAE